MVYFKREHSAAKNDGFNYSGSENSKARTKRLLVKPFSVSLGGLWGRQHSPIVAPGAYERLLVRVM